MRGRKPIPSVLADLHGNPSAGRKPSPPEPQPRGILVGPPDWMSASQRLGWEHAIDNAPPGLLRILDRGVLAVWVVAEDLHRQATVAQATVGLLYKMPVSGVVMQSPYLPIINRQGLIMIRAAAELGFSPCSRARVSTGGAPRPHDGKGASEDPQRPALQAFLDSDPDAPSAVRH